MLAIMLATMLPMINAGYNAGARMLTALGVHDVNHIVTMHISHFNIVIIAYYNTVIMAY